MPFYLLGEWFLLPTLHSLLPNYRRISLQMGTIVADIGRIKMGVLKYAPTWYTIMRFTDNYSLWELAMMRSIIFTG